jgi:hypothetical protein
VSTPELYGTEARTLGHAVSVACSKLGAFAAPFAVVSSLSPMALGLLLGVVNCVAALAASRLPETAGTALARRSAAEAPLLPEPHDPLC